MLIDLDKVIEEIKPHDLGIKLGGTVYKVKRLSVAEAKRFDALPKENPDLGKFLESLFDGAAPPVIGKLKAKRLTDEEKVKINADVLLIIRAISRAYIDQESLSKKLERADAVIKAQIQAATSGTA